MINGMIVDKSYQAVTGRKGEIIEKAMGIDYSQYESGSIAFDYEALMNGTGYSLEDHIRIQREFNVGNTPIFELHNLTALARKYAKPGKGARIFVKDEASNPAGSFKERRAATSVYHAKKMGYKGVIAATSGNYGAAVASQAAMQGLKCIIVQECYDSKQSGQPEIIEKARKCEALGAEVLQLSVGPELFYEVLMMLEETGYFNASLYSAFGVGGVETLGWELGHQFKERYGRNPDVVVCANAGGGNLTGTARGLRKAGCNAQVVAASVDLKGLSMASDAQFNRKSFTTAHTGFGMPYAIDPDHSDVPRSAARPIRYMDRYVTVKQGEVFYITEALATLEGMERAPQATRALPRHSPSRRSWMRIRSSLRRKRNTPARASTFSRSWRLRGRTASNCSSAIRKRKCPARTSCSRPILPCLRRAMWISTICARPSSAARFPVPRAR